MFSEIVARLYLFIIPMCLICAISFTFILPYSSFLYKKLQKTEPEFFSERNFWYYWTRLNSTQFIFYILLNYYKKIKDPNVKKRCHLIRNYSYLVLFPTIIATILGMFANYYFQNRPFP